MDIEIDIALAKYMGKYMYCIFTSFIGALFNKSSRKSLRIFFKTPISDYKWVSKP